MTASVRRIHVSRPSFIAGAALLAIFIVACGADDDASPDDTSPPDTGLPQAASGEWQEVVAAAEQEGEVAVAAPEPQQLQEAMKQFESAYPKIELTIVTGGTRVFLPRMQAERSAGQFDWDVWVSNCGGVYNRLIPDGLVDPLEPALIDPEVNSDESWIGGLDRGWMDEQQEYCYAFEGDLKPAVWINRTVIPEDELNSLDQLLDPKWRGKIAMDDPRSANAVSNGDLAALGVQTDTEFVGTLLEEQEPVLSLDRNQVAQWLVRGTYPIAFGLTLAELAPFNEQGLTEDIGGLGPYLGMAWGGVSLINKAPHPNAARVYVNWLLSQEGQTAWVENCGGCNSRRADVFGPEETRPTEDAFFGDQQKYRPLEDEIIEIAKQRIKE